MDRLFGDEVGSLEAGIPDLLSWVNTNYEFSSSEERILYSEGVKRVKDPNVPLWMYIGNGYNGTINIVLGKEYPQEGEYLVMQDSELLILNQDLYLNSKDIQNTPESANTIVRAIVDCQTRYNNFRNSITTEQL